MLLSLEAVVIVLSDGVKDTTALDEGVVIVVLHVMQCVRSLSRLPTRARSNTTVATVRRVCAFSLSAHI